MKENTSKILAGIMLLLLLAGLLPIMYLGRYNHPTGDDYYYGAATHHVWEETGSLLATIQEAAEGVALQYNLWQGTYSAMFLMHLAPNVFGDWAYRLVTLCILSLLTVGIFYFGHRMLCGRLQLSASGWITICSCLTLICAENVPSAGESFFWYNGSMYYTGFLGITLFFLGLLLKYTQKGGSWRVALLILLGLFLSGGNYVTLLPVMILLFLYGAWLFWQRKPGAWGVTLAELSLIAGLIISAAAPGNKLRQDGMWQIPAWKAVAKSLLQGLNYTRAWVDLWWLLAAAIITPILWKHFKKGTFRFRYPLIVIGLLYGIFCSMSCPTFYTMNSTGPARAVAVVYYGFILFSFTAYGYLLGYIQRIWQEHRQGTLASNPISPAKPTNHKWGSHVMEALYKFTAQDKTRQLFTIGKFALPALVLLALILTGGVTGSTTGKSIKLLASGEAAAYEQEYRERCRILTDDGVQNVVFKTYQTQPELLYVGDISSDPEAPGNVTFAQFFNKESVIVEYE